MSLVKRAHLDGKVSAQGMPSSGNGFGTRALNEPAGDMLELLRARGYSYRQIAYMTGTPRQTVHDRVRGLDRSKRPPLPEPSPFSLLRPI